MDSSSPHQHDRDNDADGFEFDDQGKGFQTPEANQWGKRKQNHKDGDEQPKTLRQITPRSGVWVHFTRLPNNRNICTCHYCKREYKCPSKSGTKNLWNHLEVCKEHKAWLEGKDPKLSQHVINKDGNLQNAKVPESVFREASNEMLVIGELPLSLIESMAWRHFCSKMNLYKPHSRRTATRDIVEMFIQRKSTMRKWFIANKQRVSLTTDIWVSDVIGASYMVITAHYIYQYWRLKKLIIGFKYVTYQKGKTIATTLLDCLADWGIEKVFSITVDNATANTNALSKFETAFSLVTNESLVIKEEFMHVRCAGHIINLIVRDGLTEVSENRAIKYKVAFDKMETEDKLYNDHFLEIDNGKKRVGPPTFNDWRAVESYDSELKIKAEEMYKKFDKYWDGLSNINLMLRIAIVFDPSKKLHFAKICFAELYGEETPTYKEMYDKVYNLLVDMFKEYSDRYAKSQPSQPSQSSQSQPFQSSQPDVSEADSVPRLFTIDKRYKAALNDIGVQVTKDELTTYLKEAVENPDVMMGTEYDVLSWWKFNCGKYPILSKMARDVFVMQVSSVSSKSAFSTSGRIIEPCRSCLTPYMVEVLMCTAQWMKQDIAIESRVLTNAQILAEVEYEDRLEKEFCIED
ncbi:PREDICTED: zinc finger BED domain-containing protein RICESLEEPER 2-like [Camelina sativa]|uniref:Zinc finger BED domain-containing protein RICESLEEPER 2-like n=1 Tax=Camelina sativa TaxID=90675 RepID=A0ABM0USN6_CAMSA|nr:PREDICTED: zinc finger BED domain-containing protein RICESLEEPER 2-like [Camelina sativa]